MTIDAHIDRQIDLVLGLLRASCDAKCLLNLEGLLSALEARKQPLSNDSALLRRMGERLQELLESVDHEALSDQQHTETSAFPDKQNCTRQGKSISCDELPSQVSAFEAASELVAREEVMPGATASNGWSLAARLSLNDGTPPDPTMLWALRAPSGDDLVLVATGRCGPEIWSWDDVRETMQHRKLAFEMVKNFLAVIEPHDRAAANERRESLEQFFRKIDAERAARESIEKLGVALLHLLDGQPIRVDGANVVDADGKVVERGVQARRIDVGLQGPLTETPKPWPWEQQVWSRPISPNVWRRGRLRLTDDRADFVDEPTATSPDRGDGKPWFHERGRSLERDLLESGDIRRKAMNAEVYCRMLVAALRYVSWRPADGAETEDSKLSPAELISLIMGTHDDLDWEWNSPTDMLDEEVLADLRMLGWEPDKRVRSS